MISNDGDSCTWSDMPSVLSDLNGLQDGMDMQLVMWVVSSMGSDA